METASAIIQRLREAETVGSPRWPIPRVSKVNEWMAGGHCQFVMVLDEWDIWLNTKRPAGQDIQDRPAVRCISKSNVSYFRSALTANQERELHRQLELLRTQ